jgi:hypothetical protein
MRGYDDQHRGAEQSRRSQWGSRRVLVAISFHCARATKPPARTQERSAAKPVMGECGAQPQDTP